MTTSSQKTLAPVLRRQIQKRRRMFLQRFAAMRQSPTCRKTHGVSTVIRRLLVMHRLVKTLYGRQLLKKPAISSLKSFRKMLGDVRDAQEIGLKFQHLYEEHRNPFFQSVSTVLKEQEDMLLEELLQAARAVNVKALDRSLKRQRVQKILSGEPACSGRDYIRGLHSKFAAVAEKGLEEKTPLQLHQIRIQFKKLRYAAEFLAPIIDLENAVLDDLHDMQDVLGEAHDWLVLRQTAESLLENVPEEGADDAMAVIQTRFDESHKQAWEMTSSSLPQLKGRLG